jgi:hypothetical protein
MPFFEFFYDRGRTDGQYPRCIANAAGMQGHLDDLLLHVRRLPGVGLFQEKRPSAIRTRPAPIPLLTFWSRALPDDISPVTVWTMQRLGNHGTLPHKVGGARLPTEDSRSTALKHLPLMFRPAGLLTTPVAPTDTASCMAAVVSPSEPLVGRCLPTPRIGYPSESGN